MSTEAKIASRYATALLQCAEEQDSGSSTATKPRFPAAKSGAWVEKLGGELRSVETLWSESGELRAALQSPTLDARARGELLVSLGKKLDLSEQVVSTLRLLSDRRRLSLISHIRAAYFALAQERSNFLHAEVSTASELPPAYLSQLKQVLEDITGKSVLVEQRSDPSLVAGVVTRIGDRVYDGSLRRRLEVLGDALGRAGAASG